MSLSIHFPKATQEQLKSIELLEKLDQAHLCDNWSEPGNDQSSKDRFLEQVQQLDSQYPGGLSVYVNNAKKLLEASKTGANPFEGFTPKVPAGQNLTPGNDQFTEMEQTGIKAIGKTGFVLVAGGLGERLGYSGIKIALPSETTTQKPFIQLYIETILGYQTKARQSGDSGAICPLAIMTSGDTHDMTVALLKDHDFFGMSEDQITIMKQEKVPSLIDNNAHFTTSADDPYLIETKPHGHGDVHVLMALTGTGQKWQQSGVEHILFFQDTNGIVFNCVPAALGVSISEGFEVNSITVPRRAGEAAGGIVRLEKEDGSALTLNVEYNQLDPLLRSTINPEGDVADQSGHSPYPGNINVLVFALKPYLENLSKNGGLIPEFVNPKYTDSTKESFKKPTRLECMMQDYPKLLGPEAKVGFTSFPRQFCFSAVKNNLSDAALKSENNLPAESASSGEMDIYGVAREKLKLVGVDLEEASPVVIKGIHLTPGPRVVLGGGFSSTIEDLKSKLKNVKISANSTLVIDGDVDIDGLVLNGKLVVIAKGEAKLSLRGLNISNGGDVLVPCADDAKEEIAIRGYTLEEHGVRVIESDQNLTVTE